MVKEAGEGIRGGREAKLRSASQLFAFAATVVVVIIVENAGGRHTDCGEAGSATSRKQGDRVGRS